MKALKISSCATARRVREPITRYDETATWFAGTTQTPQGVVPTASTRLRARDVLGAWKVRWGIGRMKYTVAPGLYAVGKPDPTAPVLVSANYKLTFDMLRRELSGQNCWLLVLDTRGVNVWCAAGKGTFGTDELVRRIGKTRLAGIVAHKTLIVPQLGASGICAHAVARRTGFRVVYGPVRASDIPAFLAAGQQATREMRTVRFTAWDRLVLTPVELTAALRKALPVLGVWFLLNLFAARPFGVGDLLVCAGAVVAGTVLTPLLLPLIPGRAFSWKGWFVGLAWAVAYFWLGGWFGREHWAVLAGYLLALPALSGYLAMNFTGSSTYTSFSGVTKEMKTAIPILASAAAVGVVLLAVGCMIA